MSEQNATDLSDMARIESRGGSFFIFKYEASRADATATDQGTSDVPVSQQGVEPWNDISREEASAACRRKGEGYRLPSKAEWREAYEEGVRGNTQFGASRTPEQASCSVSELSDWNEYYCLTGSGPRSWETETGVADLRGNLWEWTSDTQTRQTESGDVDLAVRAGGKWSTGKMSSPFIADRTPDYSSTDIGFRCVYSR